MNANKWNKAASAVILVASLCVLLAGCSSSPSAGDGERAIQDRIKEQSEGRIKLIRFNKSDAVQGEVMGVKFYSLEFDAEIEFAEDCKWVIGMFGQQLSFRTSKPVAQPKSGFSWNSFMDDTVSNPGTLVKKGQQVKMSGAIRFVKKEKGWSVEGVELKKTDVGNAAQSASTIATPGEQIQAAPVQTQRKPPLAVPANADKETLDALAESEREYRISLSPMPDSGDFASVFTAAGMPRIRFVESDIHQGKIKAVITDSSVVGKYTNVVSLAGEIDGGKLSLRSSTDPSASMVLALRQSYRKVAGEYSAGQSAGTVELSLGDSYLIDADPTVARSLFWIGMVGKALFGNDNSVRIKTNDTQIVHFPESLSAAHLDDGARTGLRDHSYIYVAGIELDFNQFPKDKRVMLFEKPSASARVIPIYCMDQVVRKTSPAELDKLIKGQTGKSVAELISEQEAAKENALKGAQLAARTPRALLAVDYTVQGIRFGTALTEIKAKLPGLIQSTNRTTQWEYTRQTGLSDAYRIVFELRDEKVFKFRTIYSLEDAAKLGGWQAILTKLKEKFGEPDTDSRGVGEYQGKQTAQYLWTIRDANRKFEFVFYETSSRAPGGFVAIAAEDTLL